MILKQKKLTGSPAVRRSSFVPRLGKRSEALEAEDHAVLPNAVLMDTFSMNNEDQIPNSEEETDFSPYFKRAGFAPRLGKKSFDIPYLTNAEELALLTQINDESLPYDLDLEKRLSAFAPRLGKKSSGFAPRLGKKGNFAPRLGKKVSNFSPRLGKKASGFAPRLGKKDLAFAPRLGKRSISNLLSL